MRYIRGTVGMFIEQSNFHALKPSGYRLWSCVREYCRLELHALVILS